MTELNATIRLRPTRIGFLVRPGDMDSILKIMRICTCLWGGLYNPIIPVFRTPPKDWRRERFERIKGTSIAKGYVRFFEPDVYVEAEEGLLEEAGLGKLREQHILHDQVIGLQQFLAPRDHKDWSEPFFGLNITDVYGELYTKEQRFEFRDKHQSVLVEPVRSSGLVEAMFGGFPDYRPAKYISKNYRDVFGPTKEPATPDTWRKVFLRGARTPLTVTRHALELRRTWQNNPMVFVFDPAKPTDLIDLWNLRLEPHPVIPLPVDWVGDLTDDIRKIIKSEHREIRGTPQKLKYSTTIEFARSFSEDSSKSKIKTLCEGLPQGSASCKMWRNRVWVQHTDDFVHREKRMQITADEKTVTLPIKESDRLTATFEALSPPFARRYAGHNVRWVNAMRASTYGREVLATVLPFNTFDNKWPRLAFGAERVLVGSEGWVFTQRYKKSSETVHLQSKEDAITGSLDQMGIKAKLSEPGHIAKQMLEHLGGLWGVRDIAHLETIELLNDMAGGIRRKGDGAEAVEESFHLRNASIDQWAAVISKRKQQIWSSNITLSDLTKNNVLRLGLVTQCPKCQAENWHTLTAADYQVTCDRCLKQYDFPQANLKKHNKNWSYRVIGPFSVPDYGRGSYSSLLSLRAVQSARLSHDQMTFSTAMDLEFGGKKYEADFIAWWRKGNYDDDTPPSLIIGESKSLGKGDLLKPKDIDKLRSLATKLPGAVILISVMRDHFTPNEKKVLTSFVKWARRPNDAGQCTNPVILFTGHELFTDHNIASTWKELDEPWKKFGDYQFTSTLEALAESSQVIYLGLPRLHEVREEAWKKRAARRKARANPSRSH